MTKNLDIHHDLIEQLRMGNEMAARDLYQLYAKAMYNTLIRISGNAMDAEDLLQEAFVKAFRKIHLFRGQSTFGAWLKRIVVNTGLEFLRSKKVDFGEFPADVPDEAAAQVPDELAPRLVHEAIQQLPEGSRTVLSLFLLEGYTHKEIAQILGISESTSKTQYMRGKALLRTILEPQRYG